jgi:hypothetical protein
MRESDIRWESPMVRQPKKIDIITLNADVSQLSAPKENFDIKVQMGPRLSQFWFGHPRIGSRFCRDALLDPGKERTRILYILHYL